MATPAPAAPATPAAPAGFDWKKWGPIFGALGITTAGGGISSALGKGNPFSDFFLGTENRMDPFNLFSPQQEGFQNQITQGAQGQLPDIFSNLKRLFGNDEESLNEYSAPYLRNFKTNTLPLIFERFGASGDNGGSSGLQNAATEAASGLHGQIASDRQKMQLAGLTQFGNLASQGLTPQRGYQNVPGQPGAIQSIAQLLPLLALL